MVGSMENIVNSAQALVMARVELDKIAQVASVVIRNNFLASVAILQKQKLVVYISTISMFIFFFFI